ncbi:hypothetical protein AB833_21460 [Chromatiales bacterium (ex Bugula neritina AB1)]|nr:hypothetical protein AB833_21460 [Chromatiales bacterium (ex Bugula neritina AB1)]
MDVDYRTIEIPDDFVVLVGDTSTPLKPDAPERMTNEVPTVDESGVLIQQEFVSLKEVSSTKLPKAETLQPSSAVNHRLMMLRDTDSTHLTDNEIQPDPQPNTPIINASTKSPLTGVRHPVTASARPNNALTSYRTLTKADFNPFSTLVSWQFVPGTNVGEAVRRLATFIGYRVVVPSPQVNAIYAMPLPYIHRQVKHLKVQTAFEVIGGDGMFVVVDHRTREIAHHIKSLGETAATLPGCFELGFVEWESTTTGYCPVRDKRCRL